ncbi:MAG: sensor domain-containing diguanylate cyclase [Candidatus Firestonebacteria bacterium]
MIRQLNDFIKNSIKEGQVRLLPWLLQTTSFVFMLLLLAVLVIDVVNEPRPWIKYAIFFLFIYFFVKKDIETFWQIRFLQNMNKEIRSINKITEALRSTMKLENLLDMILKSLTIEFRYERAFIFLKVKKGDKEVLRGEIGVGIFNETLQNQEFELDESVGLIPKTALSKKPFIVKDAKNDYRCEQKLVELLNLKEFATVPLIARDNVLGVLVVVADGYSRDSITEEDVSLLDIFANQSAIAIQNARFYETIEQFSLTDGLTGLYNHRYFQDMLRGELESANNNSEPLSLIYLDIDNFKNLNDTYGHQYGDKVLQDIGQIMRRTIDTSCIAARYGGEEFAVILPDTSKAEAAAVAETIREGVENHIFEELQGKERQKVTVSVGVSSFPDDALNNIALIETADKRLYSAKKSGKNKVVAN